MLARAPGTACCSLVRSCTAVCAQELGSRRAETGRIRQHHDSEVALHDMSAAGQGGSHCAITFSERPTGRRP